MLFVDTEYENLMHELTHGQGVWKRQPSTVDFTTFQMHSLTPVAKVWYNFLCVKIKPTLHLSTIMKDKTILLYAMTKGFKFDIGSIIEWGLTHERCTGALYTHHSLSSCADWPRSRCWTLRSRCSSTYPYHCPRRSSRAWGIQMRRPTRILQQPHPVQETSRTATLRSPPARLSPWHTIFMRSPHGLTHIGMSFRSTVLP